MSPRNYIDEADLPTSGTAKDGRKVRLIHDAALLQAYEAWVSEACQHTQQMIGKSVNAAGADYYKRYCKTCGIATTQHISYRDVEGQTVTLIDDDKRQKRVDQYAKYRREQLDMLADAAAERSQPSNRGQYAEYLNSPEWRARRSLVMERANGICEGCLSCNASQVHHTTYKNVGNEFMFELLALCDDCHSRLHRSAAA